MENIKSDIESLFEKTTDYVEIRINLIKLQATEKSADIISSFFSLLIVSIIISLVFFIVNIGLAIWIGNLLGKLYAGFFVIAGLYVLVGMGFYFFTKKYFKEKISNIIIKKLLK